MDLLCSDTQISGACNDTEHRFGSAQDSHWCYECRGLGSYCPEKPVFCPIGFSKCMSTTTILQIGDTAIKMKQKECIEDCQDSSVNYGILKTRFSCCSTRLCNYRDAPDPRTNAPNGRTCYSCDGQSCSNTVSCSGTEDRCITATVTYRGPPMLFKGCASKYICGALKCSFIHNVSCCEGDLCNGDKRVNQAVTQGFRNNADESVNQSVTQSLLQSFMYPGAKSVTKRLTYNDAKRVTHSIVNNHGKRVGPNVRYNNAKSVSQSFLFLCCSLLFYFL
ncbi:urokinase plasminogen activator surface receptor-like [Carassius auratus]|uniref:Urokinase plasminogen activator surface receptor-like n=1 Tax=Carassius auratus TaxID=7957 RepID=A0A6P6PHI6_CARAU|nr:urokinase plasminogen activator surface receptor-like [Carassius auratus]